MSETVISADRYETLDVAMEMCRIYMKVNTPVYLHSAPGIGKSSIMQQLAAQEGIGFKDYRVSTMLPEDLTGIPVPDLERRVATWLRAEIWPSEKDGARGILAFDELSDANKSLQSAIYRLILDRQIGDYKLPDGWWPMAAGNRREDRAAAQSISTALANRFAHISIKADVDVWARWAYLNDIDPMLIGFLRYRQDLIHNMTGELAFPSPRSWVQASKVFNQPSGMRYKLIAGNVGEGAATEVEAFFGLASLPDLNDIIKDPTKADIPEPPGSRFALSALLARKIDTKTFPSIYKYITREKFGADFMTVVMLDATKRDEDLCDTAQFKDWAINNDSIVI